MLGSKQEGCECSNSSICVCSEVETDNPFHVQLNTHINKPLALKTGSESGNRFPAVTLCVCVCVCVCVWVSAKTVRRPELGVER